MNYSYCIEKWTLRHNKHFFYKRLLNKSSISVNENCTEDDLNEDTITDWPERPQENQKIH